MAGLNEYGFESKRLPEIIAGQKAAAEPIFNDLIPTGEVLDTSNSSTLGRLISLNSLEYADLWELAQMVYLAFTPSGSWGKPLEELVSYAGIVRYAATPTTATMVVWGAVGTALPTGSLKFRSQEGRFYSSLTSSTINNELSLGIRFSVPDIDVGQTYKVSINTGVTTYDVDIVAEEGDTPSSVAVKLSNGLQGVAGATSSYSDRVVTVERGVENPLASFTVSNLVIEAAKTRMEVRGDEVGAFEQEPRTISTIATPIMGLESAYNPNKAVTGTNRETDEELKVRFRDSKFLRAINIAEALYSALISLYGVREVRIYENDTSVYDPVHDLPPHSFKPIVWGGEPSEIAREVWRNKPLGIASEGNTSVTILDSQMFSRVIKFERPTFVPISIEMDLETDPSVFSANGIEEIKRELISYFEENFTIGVDVIYSRLYTPINKIKGHQVDSLKVGRGGSMASSNVPIAYNEIASLSALDITINIV